MRVAGGAGDVEELMQGGGGETVGETCMEPGDWRRGGKLQRCAPTRTALPPGRRIPARSHITLHTVLPFPLSRTPLRVIIPSSLRSSTKGATPSALRK